LGHQTNVNSPPRLHNNTRWAWRVPLLFWRLLSLKEQPPQCVRVDLSSEAEMTLGRFLVFFVIGLVLATVLNLTWLYWILAAAAATVAIKLWLNR